MAVFGAHPGGILLGLAVLRGSAHVKPEDDERIAEIALGPGLGFVALIWAMLTISGGTQHRSTVDAAFAATITYITAGLLSMGLARVVGLHDAGEVGAERRTWIGVLVAVVAVMLAVAMPLALVVGVPLDQAIRGTLGPIGDLLVPIVSLLLLPAALLGSALVWLLGNLRGGAPTETPNADGTTGPLGIDWAKALGPSGTDAVILGLVPIVVGLVVAFLLVRRFLGRPVAEEVDRDVVEIREIEGPTGGLRLRVPRLHAPTRHPAPRTASEAYLASLAHPGHLAGRRAPHVRDTRRARPQAADGPGRTDARAPGCRLRAGRIRTKGADDIRTTTRIGAMASVAGRSQARRMNRRKGSIAGSPEEMKGPAPAWVSGRSMCRRCARS